MIFAMLNIKPKVREERVRFDFYRDIELVVHAYQQESGLWIWTYRAGHHWGRLRSKPHLPTPEDALKAGLDAARLRVDSARDLLPAPAAGSSKRSRSAR